MARVAGAGARASSRRPARRVALPNGGGFGYGETVRASDDMTALTATHAERLLQGQPLISATSGSIADMKALRDRCLAAGIPALVGPPPCGGKG